MAPPTEQAQTKWRPALAALEGRIKEHNMMALLRLELEREVWGGVPRDHGQGPRDRLWTYTAVTHYVTAV